MRQLARRPASRPEPAHRTTGANALGRAGLSIVVAIVGALVIGFGICEWLGWPFLRGPIQSALERRMQREVSISNDFRLSLLGALKLRADSFSIGAREGERPKGTTDHFVQAGEVELVLPYSTLIGAMRGSAQPFRIRSLRVVQLDAQLWRDAQGRASWHLGGGDPAQDEDAAVVLPEFDRLIVREGRIRIDDALSRVRLVAAVSTDEGETAGNAGGLKITADGTYEDRPVRARIASSGLLPLAQSTATSPPLPLSLYIKSGDSEFEFDGQAADILHLHSLDGSFSVSGATLAAAGDLVGVTLPNTPAFRIEGRVRKNGVVWNADVSSFKAGKSSLAGEFEYDPKPETPLLSGKLRGERLVLDDLAPAVGASPRGKPAPSRNGAGEAQRRQPQPGRVLPQREFDIPSLRAMNASVAVDLKRLDLPTSALRSIAPVQANLTLNNGVLDIDDLAARAAGGQLRGDLMLDSTKQPPLWAADMRWSGIDLAKWITLRNERAEDDQRNYITGTLYGQAKLRGSGRSTAAILGSLDGSVSTWIREGSISHLVVEATGLDVAQGVGLLVVGDDPLPLHCAIAQLKATGGQLHTEIGILDTPDSTVFVTGTVSLAKEQLALTLTAKPKDFSPLTVRAPVRIEGNFEDPRVTPDKKVLGLKLAAAAALAVINPLAALIPLMDPADPAARQCADVLGGMRKSGGPPRTAAPKKGRQPPR